MKLSRWKKIISLPLLAALLIVFFQLFVFVLPALAQNKCSGVGSLGELTFCPNVSIGGEFGQPGTPVKIDTQTLGKYISAWYSLIVGVIGILATVMVMYGGFRWLTSGGGAGKNEAKDIILSALVGLVLAFLSYTILYLINPNLLTIGLPEIKGIQYDENFAMAAVNPSMEGAAYRSGGGGGGGGAPADLTTLNDNFEGTVNNMISDGKLDVPKGNDTVARPGDPNDIHGQNRAADFPRTPANNAYFEKLIIVPPAEQAPYNWDGPWYYVTFPDGSKGRVGKESDCWHVDNGQRRENFNGTTF